MNFHFVYLSTVSRVHTKALTIITAWVGTQASVLGILKQEILRYLKWALRKFELNWKGKQNGFWSNELSNSTSFLLYFFHFFLLDCMLHHSRLYTQLEYLKNKTLRQDNPHISKRRGGRKVAHRRFSLQVGHNLCYIKKFSYSPSHRSPMRMMGWFRRNNVSFSLMFLKYLSLMNLLQSVTSDTKLLPLPICTGLCCLFVIFLFFNVERLGS